MVYQHRKEGSGSDHLWWHFRRAGRPPPLLFWGGCSIREWPSLLLAQWPKTIFALGGGGATVQELPFVLPRGRGEGPVGGLLGGGYQILSFRRRRRRRRSGVTKALTFIPVPSLLFLLALATYPSFVSCLHCRDGGGRREGDRRIYYRDVDPLPASWGQTVTVFGQDRR